MKRLFTILLWSAISAAFIGPGTVTTAAQAGASHGFNLLWALVFSTLACLSLQEASARLTIASGMPLAQGIQKIFKGGLTSRILPVFVVGAVVIGCAAYQAGNILGAAAGASLGTHLSRPLITLIIGLLAALILYAGTSQGVARILGIVVALMGVAFLACALQLNPSPGAVLKGCLVPSLPSGSGMLALGLVGTTVVPYNLFLGSGLARGQTLGQARLGLYVAIPLGSIISMAILIAGTAVEGPFSYPALSSALATGLGAWAGDLFAFGLFAAGLSSAITAPLAAALSIRGIGTKEKQARWDDRSWRYRLAWGAVLAFGFAFGMAGVKPIRTILIAQALNGVLLPFVALFLWIAVNDRKLMGKKLILGLGANLIMGFSVLASFVLGSSAILRAIFSMLNLPPPSEYMLLALGGLAALLFAYPVLNQIHKRRRNLS